MIPLGRQRLVQLASGLDAETVVELRQIGEVSFR